MTDLIVTVAGTVLFWKLIARPVVDWCGSVTSIRLVPRDNEGEQ